MSQRLLREGKYGDLAIVFYMAKKFVTPFKKWKAFDLDIIDAKGKILKRNLDTREEKNSFTALDRFILRIRTLVGDNMFVKLGIGALLLQDFKQEGSVLCESGSTDSKLFTKIKENILNNVSEVTIPLAGRGEYAKMEFEKEGGMFSFNIGVFAGDEMISSLGANYLPISKTNIKLFERLNHVINNLEYGGDNENIFIDLGDEEIYVNVNYGENEIKMTQLTESENVHADFYVLFGSNEEKSSFTKGWSKFYNSIDF